MSVSSFPQGTITAGASGSTVASIDQDDDAYSAIDADGFTVSGSVTLNTDGSISWTGDSLGVSESGDRFTWPVGDASGFHCRLVYVSGANSRSGGITASTWYAMTSARTMNFSKASAGGLDIAAGNWRLDVSSDGGSTTDATNTFLITLTEDSP